MKHSATSRIMSEAVALSYRFAFILVVMFSGARALAGELDAEVIEQQANVDNEAVVIYGGTLAGEPAFLAIEWIPGVELYGHYFLARSPRNKHKIRLDNFEKGVINMRVYSSDDQLQATARLTKQMKPDHIMWTGKLFSTDGSWVPLDFSRPR